MKSSRSVNWLWAEGRLATRVCFGLKGMSSSKKNHGLRKTGPLQVLSLSTIRISSSVNPQNSDINWSICLSVAAIWRSMAVIHHPLFLFHHTASREEAQACRNRRRERGTGRSGPSSFLHSSFRVHGSALRPTVRVAEPESGTWRQLARIG